MPKNPCQRVIQAIASEGWAIRPETLDQIIAIAERANWDPEAVKKQYGNRDRKDFYSEIRGNVGLLEVIGPIFRYANIFTMFSGASSIDLLAIEFNKLLGNPDVKAIVLEIDSPGGMVSGVSEFAQMIYEARSQKPVIAYVSNLGASAAYWIASACSDIVVGNTSMLGSIGVVVGYYKNEDQETGEIVSTQSPKKRPDMTTDEGRAEVQKMVDSLATVFIDTVARNRGVSTETVLSDFGQGGMFVGQEAIDAKLADRMGSLEGLIAELNTDSGKKQQKGGAKSTMDKDTLMKEHPSLAQALIDEGIAKGKADGLKEGAEAERARIKDVHEQGRAGYEDVITEMMFDGKSTGGDAAKKINAAEKETLKNSLANQQNDAPKPVAPSGSNENADDDPTKATTPITMEEAEQLYASDDRVSKLFSSAKNFFHFRKNSKK